MSHLVEFSLGKAWPWVPNLVFRALETFPDKPSRDQLVEFLAQDEPLRKIWSENVEELTIATWRIGPQLDRPALEVDSWPLPRFAGISELATFLGLSPEELAWFADAHGLNTKASSPRLNHYRAWTVSKNNGRVRLIEAPKPRLRAIQRKLLDEILAKVPSHPAAHGFVRGRNALSFAHIHAKQAILLRFDLKDFFPSISRARVEAAFLSMGYRQDLATCLANLCTTLTAPDLIEQAGEVYDHRHLPQGAPTSPAIANYCAYRLDCRLSGLAQAAGGNYSRYADDLAFSGDELFARQAAWLRSAVAEIVRDEGFRLNHSKTKTLSQSRRQLAAGIVLNAGVGIARKERKELEAILTNCRNKGLHSQNRSSVPDFRAHLHGRICWVESVNPLQGAKLRRIFDQIPG